jgi:catechol 2,3-dioxygenase-like lactoylglutathione lyase family enzyme
MTSDDLSRSAGGCRSRRVKRLTWASVQECPLTVLPSALSSVELIGQSTLACPSVQERSPKIRALKMKGVSLLPLIDHLALRVRDVRRSRTFYERALEPFGVKVVESSQGPGFAIEGGGDFWIGEGEPPAAPVHVAFAAADRATVDKFHRAAVEAGGRDNGAPGLRPHYHAGYYAAYVIDPDGNNVEAVFHGDDR